MKKILVLLLLTVKIKAQQVPDSINVLIPASFSPNGDGKDDLFFVKPGRALINCNVWIFDRWGNMLFYSTSAAAGWNGTYEGGGTCTEDVYICSVSATGAAHQRYRYRQAFKLDR